MDTPVLTTITSYWGRPEMLKIWLRALQGSGLVQGACHPLVNHIVYFVGESLPVGLLHEMHYPGFDFESRPEGPGRSIGHYHNLGARKAVTPWIMKLDVDTIPNVEYFQALLPLLKHAAPREWFNGGMLYVNRNASDIYLSESKMPLVMDSYQWIMSCAPDLCSSNYILPAATNFICRRKDYLNLAMCDEGFRQYGWEDYYQIYKLEKHQRGSDPLPGRVTLDNVTQRCRDEISRPKAKALFDRDHRLCLLHHWHASSPNPSYKRKDIMDQNKRILFLSIRP